MSQQRLMPGNPFSPLIQLQKDPTGEIEAFWWRMTAIVIAIHKKQAAVSVCDLSGCKEQEFLSFLPPNPISSTTKQRKLKVLQKRLAEHITALALLPTEHQLSLH